MLCFFVGKRILFLGKILFLAGICIDLVACTSLRPTDPPAASQEAVLIPYWTVTPGATAKAGLSEGKLPASLPTATIPPPPTPTPFTYPVKKGDTLLAIAIRYGVSLQDLMAANPDVNPRILSIGTELIIPLEQSGATPEAVPTATPVPVGLKPPRCYPTAAGGLWCFAAMENERSQALENLSGWISLATPGGEIITGTLAIPPLDLLPAGQRLPLAAYFPAPLPEGVSASAQLLTASPVSPDSGRYLPVQVEISQTTLEANGLMATVSGRIDYPLNAAGEITGTSTLTMTVPPANELPTAGTVWAVVVAYGVEGDIVGMRKWEAQKPLPAGKHREFEITVYSSGPQIARTEVLAEARP
jgi:hypothetical protein